MLCTPVPPRAPGCATVHPHSQSGKDDRLDYLDATRAFALVLGVVFHSSLSFVPLFMGWAVQDVSTSPIVTQFIAVSHSFRMELFFVLAGLFSHMSFHRYGFRDFIRSRVFRIALPFVCGWFILRPLVVSGWIMGSASLRGAVDIQAGLVGGLQSLAHLPGGIFTGSHLWFLYYLGLITVGLVTIREALIRIPTLHAAFIQTAHAGLAGLARSPFARLILAAPTAATLWFMSGWSMDTPDKSLRPHVPALLIYGGCFLLGWLLNHQRALITPFVRLSISRWIEAGVGISVVLLLGEIERDPAHPYYVTAHVGYSLGYALTMWSLVFLTIGVFKHGCQTPNPVIRYLADSSYWMYLMHLPVVVWLQVAVADIPMHWTLKLPFVSAVTIAIALLTYDLFVRSTCIGSLLNGRRRERAIFRVKSATQPHEETA